MQASRALRKTRMPRNVNFRSIYSLTNAINVLYARMRAQIFILKFVYEYFLRDAKLFFFRTIASIANVYGRKCKSSEKRVSNISSRTTNIRSWQTVKASRGYFAASQKIRRISDAQADERTRGRRRLASSHEICKQIANSQTTYGYDRLHARTSVDETHQVRNHLRSDSRGREPSPVCAQLEILSRVRTRQDDTLEGSARAKN